MNIAIVGTGYVGLVTGACLADLGLSVFCVDNDVSKVERLRRGELPIYEPGLDPVIRRNVEGGRLSFHTTIADVLRRTEVLFIAVGTPPDEDGSADLQYVLQVARSIGEELQSYKLVVIKSTVPVGTSELVRQEIQAALARRGVDVPFDLASNPEFLKEGNAVEDFMKPDRVVVGVDSTRAEELMTRIYKPMQLNNFRVIFMDIPSAEMTKYAANAMLATRISFMNDMANLCEQVGADPDKVRIGIGSDHRIGNQFLYPGCGYGGSCFPKDVQALIQMGRKYHSPMQVVEAVDRVNEAQKRVLFEKLLRYYDGDLCGKKVTLWGLAFKPNTDDMREAPSLVVIELLLAAGCEVTAYDPVAMTEARRRLGDRIRLASDIYDASRGADAIMHLTEWREFRMPRWAELRELVREPLLLDGRNVFDCAELARHGFTYLSIGRQ